MHDPRSTLNGLLAAIEQAPTETKIEVGVWEPPIELLDHLAARVVGWDVERAAPDFVAESFRVELRYADHELTVWLPMSPIEARESALAAWREAHSKHIAPREEA